MLVLAAFTLSIGLPLAEAAPASRKSAQVQRAKALKKTQKQRQKQMKKRMKRQQPRKTHR